MPRYAIRDEDVLTASIEVDGDGLNLYVGGYLILWINHDGEMELTSGNDLKGLKWDSGGRIKIADSDRKAIIEDWLGENKMKAVKKA